MKCVVPVLFFALAVASAGAQEQSNCVREGEWTKCGPAATSDPAAAPASSSSFAVKPATFNSPTPVTSSQSQLQPVPRRQRVADAKFWLVVATAQGLNAAYRVKFGSCYPTRCVEHDGLRPNQQFAVFASLNGVMGAVAYKAKKDRSRFWWPVALMLTPLSIYDLQHRPN